MKRTFKKRTNKTYKRKYKKTLKKKFNRKLRGGDFNVEQQKELRNMLLDKGLNNEQITEVMKNLNLISQINSSTLWYGRLKFEIRLLINQTLPDGSNSIVRWSQQRLPHGMDYVMTDDEDY